MTCNYLFKVKHRYFLAANQKIFLSLAAYPEKLFFQIAEMEN